MANKRPKYALLSQLRKSLILLEDRKRMIPKYCHQSNNWAGKNHYSMDMIPELELQIGEMKAAIKGIEKWKREKKTQVSRQKTQDHDS